MLGGPTICSQEGASAPASAWHGSYIIPAQHLHPPQGPGATSQPKPVLREQGISVCSERLEK